MHVQTLLTYGDRKSKEMERINWISKFDHSCTNVFSQCITWQHFFFLLHCWRLRWYGDSHQGDVFGRQAQQHPHGWQATKPNLTALFSFGCFEKISFCHEWAHAVLGLNIMVQLFFYWGQSLSILEANNFFVKRKNTFFSLLFHVSR